MIDCDSGVAGPTGEFPLGKIAPDDQGELAVAIAADRSRGLVLLDFGTPTKWIAMTRVEALEFARALAAKARQLEG